MYMMLYLDSLQWTLKVEVKKSIILGVSKDTICDMIFCFNHFRSCGTTSSASLMTLKWQFLTMDFTIYCDSLLMIQCVCFTDNFSLERQCILCHHLQSKEESLIKFKSKLCELIFPFQKGDDSF